MAGVQSSSRSANSCCDSRQFSGTKIAPSRINLQVDEELDHIVFRSLALTPESRYANASELLEATRAIGAGFVTPDRTHLIASSARIFTIDEKAAEANA